MSKFKIAISSDHAGFVYKEELIKDLLTKGYLIKDLGTFSIERVDFPDYAKLVCHQILEEQVEFGILICGTGIGMSIAANRYIGIRAALCNNIIMAEMARAHNNSNILVLGARINSLDEIIRITDKFLQTSFEGGRHNARLRKIEEI